MGKDVEDGLDRLHRSPGGPRDIDHQAGDYGPGNAAGQATEWTTRSHSLGEARGFPLEDGAGGLWSEVSLGENPVPPVVTTRPPKPLTSAIRASVTGATPSGTVRRSMT